MNMNNIKIFLDNVYEKKYKTLVIIENLIKYYQFQIKEDSVLNDIRTVILLNKYNEIIITCTFVHNKYMELIEYIEISYNGYLYRFNA